MQSSTHLFHPWSTTSFGDATDLSAMELLVLGDHLGTCRSPHGRLFALHCTIEAMHVFMVSRFVTTLVVAALLITLTTLGL